MKAVLATLALLATAMAAAAETPAVLLAPGEALLQIAASGEDRRDPDSITLPITVSASAATTAEARDAARTKADRVAKALEAAGLRRDAIVIIPPGLGGGDLAAPLVTMALSASERAANPMARPQQQRRAMVQMQAKLSAAAQLAKAQAAIDGEEGVSVGRVELALADPRAAHDAALADAMAQGKRDAETQARLAGVKITRLARVADYNPGFDIQDIAAGFAQLGAAQRGDAGKVVTRVRVYLDYAVAPAR